MTDNAHVLDYVPPDLIDEIAAGARLVRSLEPVVAEVAHRAADVQRRLAECSDCDATDDAVVEVIVRESGSLGLLQELDTLADKLQAGAGGDRSALHVDAG